MVQAGSKSSVSGPSCQVRISHPYAITRTIRVKQAYSGWSILQFFSERFPWKEESEWENKIKMGQIRVEQEPVSPKYVLLPGQHIHHDSEDVIEPSVPDQIEIIQESEEWVVISKPAPLPVHAGGRYFRNTLLAILQERGYGELYPLHRLDAVTQGLICLAKKDESVPALSAWLRSESAQKVYYAHVSGVPMQSKADIQTPIRRKQGFIFESVPEAHSDRVDSDIYTKGDISSKPKSGRSALKKAHTKVEVLHTMQNSAIVRCIPVTGRTHQLRIHLRDWGHPILDDPIYGPNGDDSGELLQNRAISLLSARIVVPQAGLSAELPVPREWRESESESIK